jgi:hypothetical protein
MSNELILDLQINDSQAVEVTQNIVTAFIEVDRITQSFAASFNDVMIDVASNFTSVMQSMTSDFSVIMETLGDQLSIDIEINNDQSLDVTQSVSVAFTQFEQSTNSFLNNFNNVMVNVSGSFNTLMQNVVGNFDGVQKSITDGFSNSMDALSQLGGQLDAVMNLIRENIKTIKDTAPNLLERLFESFLMYLTLSGQGLKDLFKQGKKVAEVQNEVNKSSLNIEEVLDIKKESSKAVESLDEVKEAMNVEKVTTKTVTDMTQVKDALDVTGETDVLINNFTDAKKQMEFGDKTGKMASDMMNAKKNLNVTHEAAGLTNNMDKAKKAMDVTTVTTNMTKDISKAKSSLNIDTETAKVSRNLNITKSEMKSAAPAVEKTTKGFGGFFSGLAKGFLIVGAGLAVLDLATKAWKWLSELGIRAAIDREREFIEISEETEDKIVAVRDRVGDYHAAVSTYMGDIVKFAKMNKDNFEQYAIRTTEIIDDLNKGSMSANQAQEAMGKAFTALLQKAQSLGTEGSRAMVDLIKNVRESGLQVAEVQEYVNQKLGEGSAALKVYLSTFDTATISAEIQEITAKLEASGQTIYENTELSKQLTEKQHEMAAAGKDVAANWSFMQEATSAMFSAYQSEGKSFVETTLLMGDHLDQIRAIAQENGLAISGSIKEMTDMSEFIRQNETLVTRVDATNKIMTALTESAYLTQTSFTTFSKQAVTQFESLKTASGDEEKALQLLAPQLNKLNEYANSYNLTLDSQTRSLIAKGRAAGVVADKETEIFNRMNDLLYSIAKKLQADIPNSAKNTKQALEDIKKKGGDIDLNIDSNKVNTALNEIQKSMKGRLLSMEYRMELRGGGLHGGMHAVRVPIEINEDSAKKFLTKYQPAFKEFLGELKHTHNMDIDFKSAQGSFSKMYTKLDKFKAILKANKINLSDEDATTIMVRFSRGMAKVRAQTEKEMRIRIKIEKAQMENTIGTLLEGVTPFVDKLEKKYKIDIKSEDVKKAIEDGKGSLVPFVKMLEKKHKLNLDPKEFEQLKSSVMGFLKSGDNAAQVFGGKYAVQMATGFEAEMAERRGFSFDIGGIKAGQEEILQGDLGLDQVRAEIDQREEDREKNRIARRERWKEYVNDMANQYNIYIDNSTKGTDQLAKKTKAAMQILNDNNTAWTDNAVTAGNMKEMIQAILDEYERLGKEAPADIRKVADEHKIVSTAVENYMKTLKLTSVQAQTETEKQAKGFKQLYDTIQNSPKLKANFEGSDKDKAKVWEEAIKLREKLAGEEKNIPDWLDKIIDRYQKAGEAARKNAEDEAKRNEVKIKYKDTIEKINKTTEKFTIKMKESDNGAKASASTQIQMWNELNTALNKYDKDYAKLPKEQQDHIDKLKTTKTNLERNLSPMAKIGLKAQELSGTFGKWGEGIGKVGQDVMGIVGPLAQLGIVSGDTAARVQMGFEGATEVMGGLGQGAAGVGKLMSGDIIGGIQGVLGGVTKVFSGVKKIWTAIFGDKWKNRAKKALKGLEGVSDEMVSKLQKRAKELKSTQLAMNELMAEFINEAAITTEKGLQGWSGKVQGMMDQLKTATGADAEKLTQQIGDSFTAMVEKADKLNLHGSKAMVGMIQKARELKKEGKEIPEVWEYVNERLTQGAEAVKTYLGTFTDVSGIQKEIGEIGDKLKGGNASAVEAVKLQGQLNAKQRELDKGVSEIRENWDFIQTASLSTFTAMMEGGKSFVEVVKEMGGELTQLKDMAKLGGMEISGGMKEMTDLADFVSQNEKLATRIDATNTMMESLGDTSFMTGEDFTNFSTNAQKQFDDLIKAGADEKQALRLLAPQLDNLIKYSKTYGITIDAQTQKLINRGKQEGVLGKQAKTEGEQQIDLQERMVGVLEKIGEHFGVVIPKAMDETSNAGSRVSDTMRSHWEEMGIDADEMAYRLSKGFPGAWRYYQEAGVRANRAVADSTPQKTIDDYEFSIDKLSETIRTDLIDANTELDDASKESIGNVLNYLRNTTEGGKDTVLTFGEIKAKMEELGGSFEQMLADSPGLFMEISDGVKQEIEELTGVLGDKHAATSMMMDQIIGQAEIDVGNFDMYAARTAEIITDFTTGALDMEQTQEVLGSAFSALMADAEALGMEGTANVVALMEAAKEAGLEVAEIHDYVAGKLEEGTEHLTNYINSYDKSNSKGSKKKEEIRGDWDFMQEMAMANIAALQEEGYSTVEILGLMQEPLADLGKMAEESGMDIADGLARMTNLAKFNEENQGLMTRIEATRGMMESLGDSGKMTGDQFASFSKKTIDQFNEIMAKTGDAETAYRLMGPAMEDLEKYSTTWGYSIDGNTQSIINQGKEQGLVAKQQKSDAAVTNDILLLIAETLGAKIPESFTSMANGVQTSMATVQNETNKWGQSLDDVERRMRTDLPAAADAMDENYKKNVSGNTIIKENEKWKGSLLEIDEILGKKLPLTADEIDAKYSHVMGNVDQYLANTSSSGYKARLSLGGMVGEMEKLQGAYGTLGANANLDKDQQNLLNDYKRQMDNLRGAIEETVAEDAAAKEALAADEKQRLAEMLASKKAEAAHHQAALEKVLAAQLKMAGEDKEALEKLQDTYKNMDQTISKAEINADNFGSYTAKTSEIIAAMNVGIIDSQTATEALGKSFNALMGKAKDLGLEGSREMLQMMVSIKSTGLEIGEMQGYVNGKLESGVAALDKYIGSFKTTGQVTEEYDDLNSKLDENSKALADIDSQRKDGGKTLEELAKLRQDHDKLEKERLTLMDSTIAKEKELAATEQSMAGNWEFMQTSTLSMFKALQAEGHSFVEIVGKMDNQLSSLHELAGENPGLEISEGLKEMTDMAGFVKQNEDLSNRIDATKTMMEALGDSAYMSANDFSSFAGQATSQFNEIIARGGDSKTALRLMGPALEDLVKYSESYGYAIDDNTQGLIDQAREQGVMSKKQKSDAQITNDLLLLMAETMGATIPDSIKEMTGAMEESVDGVEEKTTALDESLSGVGTKIVEELPVALETQKEAIDGHMTQISEMALVKGGEISENMKAMTDDEALKEQQAAMIQEIDNTRMMMMSLGESSMMTGEDFTMFAEQTKTQFEELVEKTGDKEQALRLLGPAFEELNQLSETYGFSVDGTTKAIGLQAKEQEMLTKKTTEETKIAKEHLKAIAEKFGIEIPDSLKVLSGDVKSSMVKIDQQTGTWQASLQTVEGKIKTELPAAIKKLDKDYTQAMTGNSIVTETNKWKGSLEDVNGILGRDLLETAESLDGKYKHVMGNIYEYLQKTSKEGYMSRLSFGEMVTEVDRLKNSYDKLAIKKKLSDKDKNLMDDYKRQIGELSEAIEETAPTIENFANKFKDLADSLDGDIGVNKGIIGLAKGIREQGESFKELDDQIDKSLSSGSKGLGAWINALGPAKDDLDDLKKIQEDYNKAQEDYNKVQEEFNALKEIEEKDEIKLSEALAERERLFKELEKGKKDAQKSHLDDQAALENSQHLMVAYFRSMQAEGKSVAEIMDVMGDGFQNLADKSLEDLGSGLGFEMTKNFETLYAMQQKMGKNEDLIAGIEGLKESLHGMGDSMLYMSDEGFGHFEKSAVSAFDKLIEAGFSQNEALQMMAPTLQDLSAYAEEYQFSLSGGVGKLLDEAKQGGMIREKQKSDTEKLIEVNEKLAGVMQSMAESLENMSNISPFAGMVDEARALEQAQVRLTGFQRKQRTTDRDIKTTKSDMEQLFKDLDAAGGIGTTKGAGIYKDIATKDEYLEGLLKKQVSYDRGYEKTSLEVARLREDYNRAMPKEFTSAALGYHGVLNQDRWFRLHKGEQVDVWTPEETQSITNNSIQRVGSPDGQPSRSNSDIVFEHITIQSEDGEETVREFMTAIKGNKYGVQNLIRKVAQ